MRIPITTNEEIGQLQTAEGSISLIASELPEGFDWRKPDFIDQDINNFKTDVIGKLSNLKNLTMSTPALHYLFSRQIEGGAIPTYER
ncbi:hypothetical protein AAHA92_33238 [Salvia divinorum]|uniref:Uncharacterized protein n=1 Tax=Salvia divinorum TaxID=28513 RepID=A0ABD1FRK7_SALDI